MEKVEYRKLKNEMIVLSEEAPAGSHIKVANYCKISKIYSQQIRRHKGAKLPIDKNIALVEKMKKRYIYLIEKKKRKDEERRAELELND